MPHSFGAPSLDELMASPAIHRFCVCVRCGAGEKRSTRRKQQGCHSQCEVVISAVKKLEVNATKISVVLRGGDISD